MIRKIVNRKMVPQTNASFSKLVTSASCCSALMGLLLVACASTPPPTQQIQLAEVAINHAKQAQVADSVSPELTEAREKLTAARAEVNKDNMLSAQMLAEQSAVDADLASAKFGTLKAKAVNDEMTKSTVTLKHEMKRNLGEQ